MAISIGDTLPNVSFTKIGDAGPEAVQLSDLSKDKKLVIFAVPGAYTPTCSSAHMPSFVRTADQFRAKGVDDLICVSVNDPFVMKAWGTETGAHTANIHVLSDAQSEFTTAIGMDFSAPPAGLIARSKRYAMIVENGVVTTLQVEDSPDECTISGGESLLETL